MLVESRRHHDRIFSEAPTAVPWVFGLTLLAMRRAATLCAEGDPPGYPVADYNDSHDYIQNFLNGTIVFTAFQMNTHVVPYLLGADSLEVEPVKQRISANVASRDHAVAYVRDNFALWKGVHGSIEWIYRCQNTYFALRHLGAATQPEKAWPLPKAVDTLDFFTVCLDRAHAKGNVQWDTSDYVSDRQWDLCEKAFDELDLDGSGTLTREELKLWLPRLCQSWLPEELPRQLRPLRNGRPHSWAYLFEHMDEDQGGEIERTEFREFWHRLPPGVFTEIPVSSDGRDFLFAIVTSSVATVAHLKIYLDLIVEQGITEFASSILDAAMDLTENDARRDFLDLLFDYNDDVRSVLVNSRGLLIETAVVNGSWQSCYTILSHCMLMRRDDLLRELMIPLLTSEVYFIHEHRIRYSQGVVSADHITPHHSWKKCIDVLIRFGLSAHSVAPTMHAIGSNAMRKLIKRVIKSDKAKDDYRPRHPPPVDPIQVGPSSPVRFQTYVKDSQYLRTGPFCYLSPPKKYNPAPEPEKPASLEEQHPLVVYWRHRLEEVEYVKSDVEGYICDADEGRDNEDARKQAKLTQAHGLPLAQRNRNQQATKQEWPVLKRTFSPAQMPYKQPMGLTNFP